MRVLFISLIIIVVDQVSKFFVKGFSIPFLKIHYQGMYEGQRIPIIGDFFRLTYIENPGMAFGIDPGLDYKLLISVFSLAASIGLIVYIYYVRNSSKSLKIALAFILGGAAGNLIDRMFYGVFYHYAPLFYGRVVDFLDFDFFNITLLGKSYDRWPIFNFADSAVTIGVLILIFFYRQHQKEDDIVKPAVEGQTEIDINTGDTIVNSEIPGSKNTGLDNPEETKKESGPENGETDKGKELPL